MPSSQQPPVSASHTYDAAGPTEPLLDHAAALAIERDEPIVMVFHDDDDDDTDDDEDDTAADARLWDTMAAADDPYDDEHDDGDVVRTYMYAPPPRRPHNRVCVAVTPSACRRNYYWIVDQRHGYARRARRQDIVERVRERVRDDNPRARVFRRPTNGFAWEQVAFAINSFAARR